MKRNLTAASPFLMLLIPVFLCIALLLINSNTEIPSQHSVASSAFQLPALKLVVKAIL
jgi:hypothetical protein